MPYSYATYTGNGSTTQFAVPFGYIRREHVLATVATVSATFTWVNDSLIQMTTAPANGAAVRVYRLTPLTAPLVDFADGATLVAADLDTNARQSIYTQQELDDSLVGISVGAIPNGNKGDITTSVGGTVWTVNAGLSATKSTFTQAGTGAVARTVDSKLKDVVSVKDFGAVGDGVADDTAAIQATFNHAAVQGCKVFFPEGRYKHTGLDINLRSSIVLEGAAQPHLGPGVDGAKGSALIYTGSGIGLNVRNTSGAQFTYRFNIKDLGFWPSGDSATVQAMITCRNIQESMFYNIGVQSTAGVTVAKGIFFDGAGIVHVDNCIVAGPTVGIDFAFAAGSQSSGGVSITRCNIFDVQVGISVGLAYQLNILNNWFEGFKTGILLENGNSKLRTEAFGITIAFNNFLQSIAANTDARVVRLTCPTIANPIRAKLAIINNWCANTSGTAMPYGISFATAACTSVVKVKAEIAGNWFYGVSTAGIYSDSAKALINYSDNETLDAIDGNYLPQFAGSQSSGPVARSIATITGSVNAPSNTTENVVATIDLPEKPGLIAAFHLHTCFSGTNNANAKTLRVRIGSSSGSIINQVDLASAAQVVMNSRFSNRNSHASQVHHSDHLKNTGTGGTWLTTSTVNMDSQTQLFVTVQKAVGADTVTLEALNCMYYPS